MISLKQTQSELGVTGEPSPNFIKLLQVTEILDTIEVDENNITKHDSFLFIASAKPGEKIKSTGKDIARMGQTQGTKELIYQSIIVFLEMNPSMVEVFSHAIQHTILKITKNMLKKFLGEDEKEDGHE